MHRFHLALCLALAVGLSAGCGIIEDNNFAVNLVNRNSQAIHILAEGDSFSSSNRLEPTDNRFANFPDGGSQDPKTFRAGTNGQVSLTVTCTASGEGPPANANVVYLASGALVCEGW